MSARNGVTKFAGTAIVTPVFNEQTIFDSNQGVADFSNASLPNTSFSFCVRSTTRLLPTL